MSLQITAFEPMLRTMGLQPSLARYCPESNGSTLKTVLLAETPLVEGLSTTFDASCFVTLPAQGEIAWDKIKLVIPAGRPQFKNVHLCLLCQPQGLTLSLADDGTKVVIGTGTKVRGQIQCFAKPSVFIGDDCHLQGVRLLVGQADLVIGNGCVLNEEALLQAQDVYPLVDLSTGEVLNTGRRSLTLGRHVLVGRRATVLPNASVGDGCVIAPGSTVDAVFGKHLWLNGTPAIITRQHISWAPAFGKEAPNYEVSSVIPKLA